MESTLAAAIDELARRRGLGEAYYTHDGQLKYFSSRSRYAVLQSMGLDLTDVAAVRAALAATPPPVHQQTFDQCYQPEVLTQHKLWGLSVQLYTLRSPRSWGIGDFRDLRELIEFAAPLGCDAIGLNPLHALFPAEPAHASPYSPSSRLALNVLYICVEEVPEFFVCPTARELCAQPAFQAALAAVRATDRVMYEQVSSLKFCVLRLLYTHFREHELAQMTPRAQAFRRFATERGEPLRRHALFDTLDAHFREQGIDGWRNWPADFRDVDANAVQQFAVDHAEEIEFYLYTQWLANEQLAAAQQCAYSNGMRIGLYGDLAVGANPNGSEVWSNRALYVLDASVGAPPDPLALNGQDWGIPPMDPSTLRAQHCVPFEQLLCVNMQHVGALRIDHVMSLFRLWWVPKGFSATEGVYVHYPLAELMRILAAESTRARCLVIGEDLGTVPDEIRHAMEHGRLYHYKVLLFEKAGDRFKSPQEYPHDALATATTHDLPTLKAWWQGDDLDLRDRLQLYPSRETAHRLREERTADRHALLRALCAVGLWHWRDFEPLPEFSFALARAIHLFLGKSEAALVLLQLEDLIGMTDPVNVPGTHTEHANWQRKLAVETHAIFARPEVIEALQALAKARRGLDPNQS